MTIDQETTLPIPLCLASDDGSPIGPLLAGVYKDAAAVGGSPIAWMTPFIIAGVACLLGALIMLLTNPPARSG